jgi:hypothetical protein
MRRKIVFLPKLYSKEIVENINTYFFDKGYEIEDVLDAEGGYYIIFILKDDDNHQYMKKYILSDLKQNLIEENNQKWIKSTTSSDVKLN